MAIFSTKWKKYYLNIFFACLQACKKHPQRFSLSPTMDNTESDMSMSLFGIGLGPYQEPPIDVAVGAPENFTVFAPPQPTTPASPLDVCGQEAVDIPLTATPVQLSLPMQLTVDFDPMDNQINQNKVKGGPWPKTYMVIDENDNCYEYMFLNKNFSN